MSECIRRGPACCSNADRSRDVQWSFVGPKHGSFEPMLEYTFVGEGRGSFDMAEMPVYSKWRLRTCCLCLTAGLMCTGVTLAGFLFWPVPEAASAAAAADSAQPSLPSTAAPAPAAQGMNHGMRQRTVTRFNCTEGSEDWERNWTLFKKRWCCANYESGCPTPHTTLAPFDCSDGYATWQTAWPARKRHWCCKQAARGCSPSDNATSESRTALRGKSENLTAATTTATSMTTVAAAAGATTLLTTLVTLGSTKEAALVAAITPPSFDCDQSFGTWRDDWSPKQQVWCCQRGGRGCAFDCRASILNWQEEWSIAKKTWCCLSAAPGGAGCSQQVMRNMGCDAKCSLDGTWDTCSNHMQHAAIHEFGSQAGACSKAYSGVLQVCPSCSVCSAANDECVVPVTVPATKQGLVLEEATETTYDCAVDVTHWQKDWSALKRAWCCQKFGRGCPSP